MRLRPIGYIESADGGRRKAYFSGQPIPDGWVFVAGKGIPGPPAKSKRDRDIEKVKQRIAEVLYDEADANPNPIPVLMQAIKDIKNE